MKNRYSISEVITTLYSLLLTKLFYPRARLIRRPFYIRGAKGMKYGKGLTTGHACRIDLTGNKVTLTVGEKCELGDYVHIVAHEHVEIGDHVLIASKVFISDTSHGDYSGSYNNASPDTHPNDRRLVTSTTKIGDNVWLGENVVVLQGVNIGKGCIIGANSVVNKDIPDNCIAVGIPAKIIKKWDPSSGWKRLE